jgi:hypothetical protein
MDWESRSAARCPGTAAVERTVLLAKLLRHNDRANITRLEYRKTPAASPTCCIRRGNFTEMLCHFVATFGVSKGSLSSVDIATTSLNVL